MAGPRVRIIFRIDYGERLKTLDHTTPTWIVGSVDNDPTISGLWASNAGDITRFAAQDFDTLLATVDKHHPQWQELEVHGLTSEHAQFALRSYEGRYSSEDADAFIFMKAD